MRLALLFLLLLSTVNSFSQKELNQQKLLEDFDYAVQELKLQHQGFYQYLQKEEVDLQVANLRNGIDRSMTKIEFYKILRKLLVLMNEGHGSVNLPKGTLIKLGKSKSFLPLGLIYLDKEMIIAQNFGKIQDGLVKGVKLLTINGEPIEIILAKLFPYMATDGFNETSKYEWIGGVTFSRLYRLIYGAVATFELEIQAFNEDVIKTVSIPAIRYTEFKSQNAKFKGKRFDYKQFNFEKLNDSIAYMSVPTFSLGEIEYDDFYEKHFKEIASANIKHLIIDIQANGGGEEGNENLLFSYLSSNKIKKYRKVTMLPQPYEKNKSNKGYVLDKWSSDGIIAQRGEYTLYSDYFSTLEYAKPNEDIIYKNKLYLLTSGYTFSGGAEFASMIKMTDRAIFIGDEVGGAYEGNVSGYSQTLKLPNTKISFSVPMAHFQINVTPQLKGRGVIPDYNAPQTWEDYILTRNAKLEFAKKMILGTN